MKTNGLHVGVSATMVVLAGHAIGAVNRGAEEIRVPQDKELLDAISKAMGKNDVRDAIGMSMFGVLGRMQLAQAADSTGTGAGNATSDGACYSNCYSNCHSNCHSDCHGNRSMR